MSRSITSIFKLAEKFEKKIATIAPAPAPAPAPALNPKQQMRKIEGEIYTLVGAMHKESPKLVQLQKYLLTTKSNIENKLYPNQYPNWIRIYERGNFAFGKDSGMPELQEKIMGFVTSFYQRRFQTPRQAYTLIEDIANMVNNTSQIATQMSEDPSLSSTPQVQYAAKQFAQSLKTIKSSSESIKNILEKVPNITQLTPQELEAQEKDQLRGRHPSYR